MKNVIFIAGIPSVISVISMHYLDKCLDSGINIIYINVGKLVYQGHNYSQHGKALLNDIEVNSIEEFENLIDCFNPKDTLCNFQHERIDKNSLKIFKIIKKKGFILSYFFHSPFCINPAKSSLKEKLSKLSFKFFLSPLKTTKKIPFYIFNSIYKKYISQIISPDFIFQSCPGINYKNKNTKNIIKINYIDYDKSLKFIKKNDGYCLFIDTAPTHHPDIDLATDNIFLEKRKIHEKKYYSDMNKLFEHIELQFSLPVIIAAHPKSQFSGNEFCGRKIIKNDTAYLAANANIICSHMSSAISYALIYEKPLFFVNYGGYFDSFYPNNQYNDFIKMQSSRLDAQYIDISKEININITTNYKKYKDFKYKYFCWKEIEFMHSGKIVSDYILNLKYEDIK